MEASDAPRRLRGGRVAPPGSWLDRLRDDRTLRKGQLSRLELVRPAPSPLRQKEPLSPVRESPESEEPPVVSPPWSKAEEPAQTSWSVPGEPRSWLAPEVGPATPAPSDSETEPDERPKHADWSDASAWGGRSCETSTAPGIQGVAEAAQTQGWVRPEPEPDPPCGPRVRVVKDFTSGGVADYLELRIGEVVVLTHPEHVVENQAGTLSLFCGLLEGRRGWFPTSCVEKLPEADEMAEPQGKAQAAERSGAREANGWETWAKFTDPGTKRLWFFNEATEEFFFHFGSSHFGKASRLSASLATVTMSFTREEVAKHNKAEDAWIIVDGDVYDVTKFAGVHPGGTQILLEYAGKDATEDFYALHRLEVLDKYARLKKGRLGDAGPAPKKSSEMLMAFSKVPFAEPAHLQGFTSPYFNEGHVKLRQEARKFFVGETLDEALECEAKSTPPSKEMRKRMGDLGLIAMVQGPGPHLKIPASLCGGVVKPDEFTYFHEMVVQEERCRTMCPGYEDGLDAAVSIGLPVLRKYGSEWMLNEVVPPIIKGDQCCVLSITEAFAGSDVAGLRTTATLDASGENYVVNGTKKWITGGMYADWLVTAVRTGKAGAGGISMMLIPRSDAVQTKIMKSKYSSSAGTAYVTYENCVVPKKYLIGQENKGFQIIMSNFNHERWMITTVCIARARICTEETFKWAMQRKVFGKPLVEQPVIREKLAQMFAGVETCSQMLYDITHNMISMGSQGAEVGARIALLKYQTTRMNHLVADNAVQVFGGRGVTQTGMGRVAEVFSRMYKIPAVYGGSEEIMADLAVRTAIKGYPKTARL